MMYDWPRETDVKAVKTCEFGEEKGKWRGHSRQFDMTDLEMKTEMETMRQPHRELKCFMTWTPALKRRCMSVTPRTRQHETAKIARFAKTPLISRAWRPVDWMEGAEGESRLLCTQQ